MICQVPKCGLPLNVTVYYFDGCYWKDGIDVCEKHRSDDCDKYPSPVICADKLAQRGLIKSCSISKSGKVIIIKDGPVYVLADKESGKFSGFAKIHPQPAIDLLKEIDPVKFAIRALKQVDNK